MTDARFPTLALTALAACYFALAIASLSVIGLMIPMRAGLGVTESEIAYLVSIFSLTYALSAPLMQVALGDWDRRRLILLGLGAIALGSLMTGWADGYPLAAAGRAVMALGGGLAGPMASAAGAALVAPELRGRALGHVFSGMTVATVLGVPVVTWLGAVLGWRGALVAVALFAMATALAVWLVVPEHGRGTRASLAQIGRILTDRVLAPAISVTGWQMAGQFATYSVIAVYVTGRLGMPAGALPLLLAAFGTGGILGNWLATRLVGRFGANRLIQASLIATALSFVALQLAGQNAALGLVLLFLWSVAGLALFAPQQERLIALEPASANLLLALNGSAVYLGMGLGSALAGVMLRYSGTDWLAALSAGLVALAWAAYLLSRRGERVRASA